MTLKPVTLEERTIRLEPLSLDHLDALCEVGLDPALWNLSTTPMQTRDDMRAYIETALQWQKDGTGLPFAIYHTPESKYIGSTRYANAEHNHKRLEIGWTWIARLWQRTAVNTEAKYLLLRHAFETLGCKRVEFKTDSLNTQSRNALLRIGAKEEGIFRNHMITPSGRLRHSVYFSIIDSEWPEVKSRLEAKLGKYNARQK